MELFLELFITISLSFIFSSLFVKLVSMQLINTDKDELLEAALNVDKFQQLPFKEEVIKVQNGPIEGNKSSIELYNVVGVEKEEKFQDVIVDNSIDVVTKSYDNDDGKENSSNMSEMTKNHVFDIRSFSSISDDNTDVVTKSYDDGKENSSNMFEMTKNDVFEIESFSGITEIDISSIDHEHETGFEWKEENVVERKVCEIEIESVEEEEEEGIGMEVLDDWEEIGRKDFEELLSGNKGGLHYDNVGYEK